MVFNAMRSTKSIHPSTFDGVNRTRLVVVILLPVDFFLIFVLMKYLESDYGIDR